MANKIENAISYVYSVISCNENRNFSETLNDAANIFADNFLEYNEIYSTIVSLFK